MCSDSIFFFLILLLKTWEEEPPKVLKDSSVRALFDTDDAATPEEKRTWQQVARLFLKECAQEEAENSELEKIMLPKRLERLASFYATHASDWQWQVSCGFGYSKVFKENTPKGTPIEQRALIVENQDSYSVNSCKMFYLIKKKEAPPEPTKTK